jgi:hypothetical protein
MSKIAYLILVHSDPVHFKRLIEALSYECDIYVHVDKKIDENIFKSKVMQNNIFFTKKRYSINWAGISMIDAQLELLESTMNEKYSHIVFLSGADYPIKNKKYIHDFITASKTKEFIKFLDMRDSPEHYLKQVIYRCFNEPLFDSRNIYFKRMDKIIRKILTSLHLTNNWEFSLTPYFGSQWIAITQDCCRYILDYHHQHPSFRHMNEYTFSPDEHYFHTIIGNSCFLNNSDGIVPYEGRGTWRLANLHMIDPSLSKWFTIDDWSKIEESTQLFVRKVRTSDGLELVKKIDEYLLSQEEKF